MENLQNSTRSSPRNQSHALTYQVLFIMTSKVTLWAYLSLWNKPAAAYNPRNKKKKKTSESAQKQQQMSHYAFQVWNSAKRQVILSLVSYRVSSMGKSCAREKEWFRDIGLFTSFQLSWMRKINFGMSSVCIVQTLEGVDWSAQRIPTAVNFVFLDRSRYFPFK
jgi:hypothetical protein